MGGDGIKHVILPFGTCLKYVILDIYIFGKFGFRHAIDIGDHILLVVQC
jgi:hypothetical protein